MSQLVQANGVELCIETFGASERSGDPADPRRRRLDGLLGDTVL